ncbi:hypothetical protein F4820DRAFT_193019 [Hypoxylon rubiginosum]|uniref:Uncharacterized protein n=1 Tax=Hypoxylon rubiginosum TaxID=110542 RepID=A0ACB9Z7K2_9PEZI|nr:hypothetical protein F4820DRAFT_193019 [Hypoxylon rubiginosum]
MYASLLSPKAAMSFLAGLASLGVALAGPVEPRQTTEAAAAVSTITGYAHPLSLTPLTTLGDQQTPLSYDSPPTAITVPTRPAAAAAQATGIQDNVAAAGPQDGDALATTASVCTSIAGDYPTATVPHFCNPSALVNAPDFLPGLDNLPTATVTVGAVTNKLDCCVQCANIFNCVAWRFKPVYTMTPNAHLPGGFDPWGRGDCLAVYHTGDPDREEAAGAILASAPKDETPNLCPNGKVGEVLSGSNDGEPANATAHVTNSWTNLYYDGWNEGPCAEPVAPFEGGTDAGLGDAADLCS